MTDSSRAIGVLHARIVSGTGGGPEKTILNSPRHLVGTRYRALAAYLHAPGDPGIEVLARQARERACPFVPLADAWPIDPRALRRLADLCRAEDVRIWHGHDYKSNLYGLMLARMCDLRLVTTAHGWVEHSARTPLYFAIDRWCLRRYERVVAVSRDLEARCLELGVARERLIQVDNAIDARDFRRARPARESPRRADSRQRLVVGAVGRLSEEKGFLLLIEAVDRLLSRGHDLELWIAGQGREEDVLRQRIARSEHRARFKLLGHEPDVRGLFEAFDVFALSSLREGLPNVVLEALATETPIVATRAGGLSAFGRDEVDMLLVDVGSVEALERGLERLVRAPELRASLARAGRERVERDLSFARRMERIVAIYDGLWR